MQPNERVQGGETTQLFLPDEAATIRLGDDIASALRPGDVLALSGDLGAGKSTLARAIIRALSDDPEIDVPSPTFTLVQHYPGRLPVAHFDLYRLADPEELVELGFSEAVEQGSVLIEWPERASERLGEAVTTVVLSLDGNARRAEIHTRSDAMAERLLRTFSIREMLRNAGRGDGSRRFLTGDASARHYETVHDHDGVAIVMDAPAAPDGPPLEGGKPYSVVARLAEDVRAFVGIDRMLRDAGFSAPAIYATDLERGLVLLEHLGTDTIRRNVNGDPVPERYTEAAELLAATHNVGWDRQVELPDGSRYHVPAFDREALGAELDLLPDWYVPYALSDQGIGKDEVRAWRDRYRETWRPILDEVLASETSLLLRDFHSPNIIWRGDRTGYDRLGLIDFQDAVFGPSAYDVASLAMDARVGVSEELEAAVKRAYCEARADHPRPFDAATFERDYAIMAAQRNSKIAGIFVRLSRRDGKHHYLDHLDRIRSYLQRCLSHETLAPLRPLYGEIGLWVEP